MAGLPELIYSNVSALAELVRLKPIHLKSNINLIPAINGGATGKQVHNNNRLRIRKGLRPLPNSVSRFIKQKNAFAFSCLTFTVSRFSFRVSRFTSPVYRFPFPPPWSGFCYTLHKSKPWQRMV
jgi:hypothetical protein